MNQQIILAVVIGLVVGALLVWLLGRGARGDADAAQEKLDKLQKEFETYRNEVNAHFAQTADAVDQLTQSYQNVFSHLSDGAQKLMDKTALKAQLEKRQGKAVTLAYLVDEQGEKTRTAVAAESVVAEKAAAQPAPAPAAPPATPAPAENGKQADSKTLHYAGDPAAAGKAQSAQKSDEDGSRVLNYAANAGEADAKPADKAGAEKKPEPAGKAAETPVNSAAPKKRSVEIAAENAGLNLSHKEGEISAGETSLEAVKRHLREQNPPPRNP